MSYGVVRGTSVTAGFAGFGTGVIASRHSEVMASVVELIGKPLPTVPSVIALKPYMVGEKQLSSSPIAK